MAGSSPVAEKLKLPPDAVVQAFAYAFSVLMSPRFAEDAAEPQLQLVFQHDCVCASLTS